MLLGGEVSVGLGIPQPPLLGALFEEIALGGDCVSLVRTGGSIVFGGPV